MNRLVRFQLVAVAALLIVCATAAPSYADSQGVSGCAGCNDYTFQATLTPITPTVANGESNYSLSYTVTDVSNATPANAQSWSLTLFNSTNAVSAVSGLTVNGVANSAYAPNPGKSNNGNDNCNSAVGNAVCVAYTGIGSLSEVSLGHPLTFSFDLACTNCTELADWIFLSQGRSLSGNGNVYAISTPSLGTPVSMPEPSSPILLFCSLPAALGLLAIPQVRSIVLAPRHSGLSSLVSRS